MDEVRWLILLVGIQEGYLASNVSNCLPCKIKLIYRIKRLTGWPRFTWKIAVTVVHVLAVSTSCTRNRWRSRKWCREVFSDWLAWWTFQVLVLKIMDGFFCLVRFFLELNVPDWDSQSSKRELLGLSEALTTHTRTHKCFTARFPGPPGWAGARRELLDFMV